MRTFAVIITLSLFFSCSKKIRPTYTETIELSEQTAVAEGDTSLSVFDLSDLIASKDTTPITPTFVRESKIAKGAVVKVKNNKLEVECPCPEQEVKYINKERLRIVTSPPTNEPSKWQWFQIYFGRICALIAVVVLTYIILRKK